MNSQVVNNNIMTTTQSIERFCRVFSPDHLDKIKELEEEFKGLTAFKLQEALYKKFIEKRFIRLKDQKKVFFPSQRSPEWFAERAKVKSSITGSRPSGWYFSLKDEESYNEHLGYVHLGKKQTFDKAALERMAHGQKFEDVAALRLIEFGLKRKHDVWIYEAGFIRHKNPKLSFLGASPDGVVGITYTGTVLAERTRHGHVELLMAYYDFCNEVQCAVVSGKEKIQAGLDHIPTGLYKACTASYDENKWQKSEHEGKRISTMVHAALEIKCPQKMYSNVPLYYFCQLHMEMACYNLKEAIFVTWHVKGSVERTRIWKIKFNAAFFETFTNDVCELFRSVNADGSRGAPWPTFKQTWLDFKRTFGSVKVWKPFVTPLFENRKFSLEKEFVDTEA